MGAFGRQRAIGAIFGLENETRFATWKGEGVAFAGFEWADSGQDDATSCPGARGRRGGRLSAATRERNADKRGAAFQKLPSGERIHKARLQNLHPQNFMLFSSQNAVFVSGTDTGVGKTLVSALVALKLRQMGVDCVAFKPFASGCARENGVLVSEDGEFLRKTLNLKESSDEICPIRLEEPLAPLIAARRAGLATHQWPEIARQAFENLKSKHEFVVVEGVGGLLAPIWEIATGFGSNLDLMRDWNLPAVVVARRGLGTINHTLLSLQLPARFAGLIFNDVAPVPADDIAAQTGPHFIAQVCRVPIWGHIPFAPDFESQTLQRMAARLKIQL